MDRLKDIQETKKKIKLDRHLRDNKTENFLKKVFGKNISRSTLIIDPLLKKKRKKKKT